MASTNENLHTSPNDGSPIVSEGLLGEILSTSDTRSGVDLLSDSFISDTPPVDGKIPVPPIQEAVKKLPKKSMSTGTFLRMV